MAIEGFSPPSPSPPSPYYQLLERGSARLGRVKNERQIKAVVLAVKILTMWQPITLYRQ